MSVISSLNNLASVSRIGSRPASVSGLKPYLAIGDNTSAVDYRRARGRLLRLFEQLGTLAELADVKSRFKLDLPDAQSSAGLGLDLTETAAALASAQEINTAPNSFTPFGPDWDGASSALLTIGGVYDGSNGSDVLTFESRRNGVHGGSNLRIWLNDSQGNRLANINIDSADALDQQYDLGNGLYFTLGAGALVNRDAATLQVFDNVGAAVDPDRPLGGMRNDNPNLEFGSAPVVDGAFLVNGQSIGVSTADSINDVINRINQSSAGVTATFNSLTERVEFLQNTTGSQPSIDLSGDTSNLLDALKLSAAVVTPGIDPESEQALADVAAFSSVQAGEIVINGERIAIDTASDSLADVLDRINASGAGVAASFDAGTQRVLIEANDAESALELDSNGTAFFGALNIPDGRVDAEAVSGGISRGLSYRIADLAEAAFAELNYLFRDASFTAAAQNAPRFRAPLEAALRAALGGNIDGDLFGLRFDGGGAARQRGDFATVDRQALTESLQRRGDAVRAALIGPDGGRGLLPDLLRATRQALGVVSQALGLSGGIVDTFA